MRTAVGLLAATICIPVIAAGSTISWRGGGISLQFEPAGLRGSRDGVRPLRAQSTVVEDVAFHPPIGVSARSPWGACAGANGSNDANGVCRDYLPVTGNSTGNSGEEDFPLNPKGWEGDSEEEIWSNAVPGQSNEELVTSAFVPDSSDLVGELDADELGSLSEIAGEGYIGEAPEPSTMLLMGGGLFALGYYRRKRNG